MMPRAPRSLQQRLLWLLLALLGFSWCVVAIATWFDARHELDELLDGHLAQAAALLVVQQSHEPDDDAPSVDAPQLYRYAPRVVFQVWHEGVLLQHSKNAPERPMTASAERPLQGFEVIEIGGTTWRVFAAPGREPGLQIFVGEQLRARREIVFALLRSTLLPLALLLPLLAAGVFWAVRRGTAPLRALGDTLAARRPQALEPVVLADAPTEMLPMIEALNRLFERIEAMREHERRFTADAAHELRTPIAAIRTQAQVALIDHDDARRRHALEATIEGCDRATRLVEQLLTLSRLEAGAGVAAAAVELGAVARRVAAELAPRALARGQALEVEAAGQAPVAGDEALLAVLVRNLVDNALRYSPAGAGVRVQVRADDGAVQLVVEDGGPGLVEADRQRLGERFFRVLGSGESGSGLGWSIVRRIAAVLQAELEVGRSAALGGLEVRVRLPRA